MSTSQVTYGTVSVTVKGKTFVLTPTLAAVQMLERRYDGLRGALNALDNFSLECATLAIRAGASLKPKAAEKLPGDIFEHGTPDVCIQVIPYVVALLNPTGKVASDEEDEDDAEDDQGDDSGK